MRTSHRSAFTLIELLVVIAIIALLISILMPSLSRSKDLAREVSCRQNQRNIYMVLRLYTNDNGQLPNAWHIMERQWQGFAWRDGRDMTFLPQKLTGYMNLLDLGWFCPGWPMDLVYQDGMEVNGTPTRPMAGKVPGTPRNFGMGYYYTAWMWVYYWTGASDPDNWMQQAPKVNFDRLARPGKAKIMSCLLPQQDPGLGRVGPHNKGTIWQSLWADGSITQTRGVFVEPKSLEVYCNSVGDWASK
jgi:prepilin-type N-terminal cleavage/methylation domain-containing protein